MKRVKRHSWTRLFVSPEQDGALTSIALEPYCGRGHDDSTLRDVSLRVPLDRVMCSGMSMRLEDGRAVSRLGFVNDRRCAFVLDPPVGHVEICWPRYVHERAKPTKLVKHRGVWCLRWSWVDHLDSLEET